MGHRRLVAAAAGMLGACLVGGGGLVAWLAWPAPGAIPAAAAAAAPDAPAGGPAVLTPSGPAATPVSAAPPARLSLPAIGVDAQVEAVGTDAQGRMEVPSRAERVSWYRLGTSPGQPGNAVLAGHYDWTTGPAVFWRLNRLRIGDEVLITRTDGSRTRFIVSSTQVVAFDARPAGMFAGAGPPSLSLVTCTGSWDRQRGTYLERLVVHASLAVPSPTEKPGDEAG